MKRKKLYYKIKSFFIITKKCGDRRVANESAELITDLQDSIGYRSGGARSPPGHVRSDRVVSEQRVGRSLDSTLYGSLPGRLTGAPQLHNLLQLLSTFSQALVYFLVVLNK